MHIFIHVVLILSGAIQRHLQEGSFKNWTCGHDASHSRSLHVDVSGLRLPGSCPGAECKSYQFRRLAPAEPVFHHLLRIIMCGVFFCPPGRSERHTSDLHHPVRVLPQALHRPLVPGGKLDIGRPDIRRLVCHDHRSDHDRPLPPRLFARRRDVLLCGRQRLCHCTTRMKWTVFNLLLYITVVIWNCTVCCIWI